MQKLSKEWDLFPAHKGEHLMPTDYGVMIYRRRIRKLIKNLKEGKEPPQPQNKKGDIIKTNGTRHSFKSA